jgi:hypothetical protein
MLAKNNAKSHVITMQFVIADYYPCQTCAKFPSHRSAMLGYCRDLIEKPSIP